MMDYSEFMEYVEDNILKYLPPEYENADVELTKTLKNNNGLNLFPGANKE